MSTYLVEYAKSARSSCKTCKEKIEKGSIRFGAQVSDDDHSRTSWFHLDCWKIPNKVKGIKEISGYDDLKKDDQKKVKDYVNDEENKAGSSKWKGKVNKGEPQIKDKKVLKVSKVLSKKYTMDMLKKFLKLNEQKISGTKVELCQRVADGMVNGTLPRCPKCQATSLKYENGLFSCPGFFDDTHFKRCSYKYKEGSEEEPEDGSVTRGEWKQHNTEKDDALKEAEDLSDEETEEKPKKTTKRKAETTKKTNPKKKKKKSDDSDEKESESED